MKPISKIISYGYSKSVQLFLEEGSQDGLSIFIVVISERDINGDLRNIGEFRYSDYVDAVHHMHNAVVNFFYNDLFQ